MRFDRFGQDVILVSKEHIFGGIVLIIVLAIAKSVITTRYFHPLSQFPGPFFASISRLWIVYYNLLGKEYLKEYDLHKKYGKDRTLPSPNLNILNLELTTVHHHIRARGSNYAYNAYS